MLVLEELFRGSNECHPECYLECPPKCHLCVILGVILNAEISGTLLEVISNGLKSPGAQEKFTGEWLVADQVLSSGPGR